MNIRFSDIGNIVIQNRIALLHTNIADIKDQISYIAEKEQVLYSKLGEHADQKNHDELNEILLTLT